MDVHNDRLIQTKLVKKYPNSLPVYNEKSIFSLPVSNVLNSLKTLKTTRCKAVIQITKFQINKGINGNELFCSLKLINLNVLYVLP